jgi:3-oxochol-4-en-24-oyl-CoA dehydrogenase
MQNAEDSQVVATVTDEQSAAPELVRDWSRNSGSSEATRDVEQGHTDAW